MPKKTVQEFDDETDFEDLPEEVPKYAFGGKVDPLDSFDYMKGNEEEYDSSGEPHRDDDLEDKHPMEYMAHGGRVTRMARGGRVPSSDFVKALRRSRY